MAYSLPEDQMWTVEHDHWTPGTLSALTREEKALCRAAAVGCSSETDRLLSLIERLAGETVR